MRAPQWVRCPACRRVSGLLDISASRGGTNAYECDDCGHLWHEDPSRDEGSGTPRRAGQAASGRRPKSGR